MPTMTFNISEREMQVLEELSLQKGLSKTVVMRQALALYQLVDARLRAGHRLFTEDTQKMSTELLLLGVIDGT